MQLVTEDVVPVEEPPSQTAMDHDGEPPSPQDTPKDDQQGGETPPKAADAKARSAHEDMLKKFQGDPEKAGEDYWRIQKNNKEMAKKLAEMEEQLNARFEPDDDEDKPGAKPAEPEDDYDYDAHLAHIDQAIQSRAAFLEAVDTKHRDEVLAQLDNTQNEVYHQEATIKELEDMLAGSDEFDRAPIEKRLNRARQSLNEARTRHSVATNNWNNLYINQQRAAEDLKTLKTERSRVLRDKKNAAREREREEQEVEQRAHQIQLSFQNKIVSELKSQGVVDDEDLDLGWEIVKDAVAIALFRNSSSKSAGPLNVEQVIKDNVAKFARKLARVPGSATPTPKPPERRAPGERPAAAGTPSAPQLSPLEAYERSKAARREGLSRGLSGRK